MLRRRTLLLLATCPAGGKRLRRRPEQPITKLVEPVDVKTGWFDAGVENGMNKLVPTATLTLRNISGEPVANVQLNAVIRRVGETEEWGGAFTEGRRHRRHSARRAHKPDRAAIEPRLHWHRTAHADAEEPAVRRRLRPGLREARRQPVGEAGRVAYRARPADPVALSAPSLTRTTLERRLGPLDAAAIIVANVIGGGILFTPPAVAAIVPHPRWFLSTWLAGGALAFAGAMAYAELAALRPRAGGEYVYLREAYGRSPGS